MRDFSIQRLLHRCSAVLFMSCLCACSAGDVRQPPKEPRVDVHLQGEPGAPITHLNLPPAYLNKSVGWWEPHMPRRRAAGESPQTEVSLLFLMLWPSLEPKTKANASLFDDPRSPWMQVLLRANDPSRIDLDGQMRLNLSSALGQASNYKPEQLVEYPSRYGLHVVGLPQDLLTPREVALRDQVMVPVDVPNGEAPNVVIECMHEDIKDDNRQWNPVCRMVFSIPELKADVGVGFKRAFLPEWQQIRAKVQSLLLGFHVAERA